MSKRFILAVTLIVTVGLPGRAFAASGSGHGPVGPILFGLALLVIAAKAGGRLAERMGQPSVLGELLAGIALGNLLPLVFWGSEVVFVPTEPTILVLAQIGILVLLFDVGLETDLRALLLVGSWGSKRTCEHSCWSAGCAQRGEANSRSRGCCHMHDRSMHGEDK